jgi:integrase
MLTDPEVRAAEPRDEKPYKLADGEGLYLLVTPQGTKLWRAKYRFSGKEKLAAFGAYAPGQARHVSLAKARSDLAELKRSLRQGIDPNAAKQAARQAREDREAGTFERVALEWVAQHRGTWSAAYSKKELRQLEVHVLPVVGAKPLRELNSRDLLDVLKRIENRGLAETAHRVRRSLGAICRYAVATHRADVDASAALKGALAPVVSSHFAAITEPGRVGDLLRALDGYTGSQPVRCALRLAPLLFVRPGELRAARWDEFAFDVAEPAEGGRPKYPEPQWRIPAARMKMGEQHIVPLAPQAVAILRELHGVTGPEGYLFPSVRTRARCMSENTVNAALRGLDFAKEEMTGHGFRHLASTLLHEQGFRSEWIERQLAHGDRDKVRARYNFAEYLPERRRMMSAWAQYLDGLRRGADVVNIGAARTA